MSLAYVKSSGEYPFEFRLCLNTIVACDFPDIEDPAPVPPTAPVAPTQDEITAKAELRALFSGIYPPGTCEPTAWLRGRLANPTGPLARLSHPELDEIVARAEARPISPDSIGF